ncbi:hypothetical protein GcM3_129015 [Golovinomyces cichoracearum]|uniref:Uncharacterized protein n=1 Tax=Golovinomyces cichoracearum TaxID=62708 RepID=A0A420I593_9PEZI|nr:hypothetical protein GcM3_129015 [Golovinomyces cichoracearum]
MDESGNTYWGVVPPLIEIKRRKPQTNLAPYNSGKGYSEGKDRGTTRRLRNCS